MPESFKGIDPSATNFREDIRDLVPQEMAEFADFQTNIGPKEISIFLTQFKRLRAGNELVEVFERAKDQPDIQQSETLREYYLVGLNLHKPPLFEKTIEVGRKYIHEGQRTGETYAALGKAYRLQYEDAMRRFEASEDHDIRILQEAQKALNDSYQNYLSGYLVDYEYYPGINAIYAITDLATLEKDLGKRMESTRPGSEKSYAESALRKEALGKRLSRMVYESTKVVGGIHSSDYWCLSTMVELGCVDANESEVRKALPRMLLQAKGTGELSATLDRLSKRKAALEAGGQDAAILTKVIAEIQRRMQSIASPNTLQRSKDQSLYYLPMTSADMQDRQAFEAKLKELDISGLSQDERDTRMFYDFRGFNYQDVVQGHDEYVIGGNYEHRGQLHGHTLNRSDIRIFGMILDQLKITPSTTMEEFNTRVDQFLRTTFGTRANEDLHSENHLVDDNRVLGIKDLFYAQISGDEGLTNVAVDVMLKLGDCRQHAEAKQALYEVYRRRQLNPLFQDIYQRYVDTTKPLSETRLQRRLAKLQEVVSQPLAIVDVQILAPVKVKGMYDYELEEGRLVFDPDVLRERWPVLEDHTLTLQLRHGSQKDSVEVIPMEGTQSHHASAVATDAFYQVIYPFGHGDRGRQLIDLELLQGPNASWQVAEVETSDGTKVPVRLRRTAYAGTRSNKALGAGLTYFRGLPISLTPEMFDTLSGRHGRNALFDGLDAFRRFVPTIHPQDKETRPTRFYQEEEMRMLFGPLESLYSSHVKARIKRDFNPRDATKREVILERKYMQRNFLELCNESRQWTRETDLTDAIREFLLTRNQRGSESDRSNVRQIQLMAGEVPFEDRDRPNLAFHIQEVRKAANILLFNESGTLRYLDSYISERHAKLLVHVASEWHDILKMLSDRAGQVPPDHEFLIAGFLQNLKQNKEARKVQVGEETWTLSDEDLDFLIAVTGDHETVGKDNREHLLFPDNEIDRAKALFFLIDDFLGVSDQNEREFDIEKMVKRFTGTVRSLIDPTRRRIFDPSWAVNNIRLYKGVTAFLTMQGSMPDIIALGSDETIQAMLEGALGVMHDVLATRDLNEDEKMELRQQQRVLQVQLDRIHERAPIAVHR